MITAMGKWLHLTDLTNETEESRVVGFQTGDNGQAAYRKGPVLHAVVEERVQAPHDALEVRFRRQPPQGSGFGGNPHGR